jgi:hypothetical protein
MNVLGWNQAASGLAEFAERMPGDVGVADFLPAAVVEAADIPAALIVLFLRLRGVISAVFPRRCVRAAGVTAGLFGFPGHGITSVISIVFCV